MVKSAKQLREQYEADLKALQKSCPHEEKQWMPYMWAPGHFGGDVLVCDFCEKILKTENAYGGVPDISELPEQ